MVRMRRSINVAVKYAIILSGIIGLSYISDNRRFFWVRAQTIFETLQSNHDPKVSQSSFNLTILLNLVQSDPAILAYLNDSSRTLTFFAPSNAAINQYVTQQNASSTAAITTNILLNHIVMGSPATIPEGFARMNFKTEFVPESGLGGEAQNLVIANNSAKLRVFHGQAEARGSAVGCNFGSGSAGVIYCVDDVITPPSRPSQIIPSISSLTSFYSALNSVGSDLLSSLDSATFISIFAPSNAAFSANNTFLSGLSKSQLSDFLKYHVASGSVLLSTASAMTSSGSSSSFKTLLNSDKITIKGRKSDIVGENGPLVTGSQNSAWVTISQTDVLLQNGVLHIIDGILLPNSISSTTTSSASKSRTSTSSRTSKATKSSNDESSSATFSSPRTPLAIYLPILVIFLFTSALLF